MNIGFFGLFSSVCFNQQISNYSDIDLWYKNKSSKVEEISYYDLNLFFWKFYDIYFKKKEHGRYGINSMK